MTTVLETTDLRREFGELVAVDDVSIAIDDEDVTTIIGPNGAGKTTFYNLLTGVLAPTAGSVELRVDGTMTPIAGEDPYQIARQGLSRSYQVTNIFEGLTVRENVRIARIIADGDTYDLRSQAGTDPDRVARVDELLELTNLTPVADEPADVLSYGQKRNIEIALALAIDPTVVLLDEPTAGMNPTETDRIVELIMDLEKATETTFVVTEHDMDVVLDLSDRIIVLADGSVIADGSPEAVMNDETVTEVYLGGDVA